MEESLNIYVHSLRNSSGGYVNSVSYDLNYYQSEEVINTVDNHLWSPRILEWYWPERINLKIMFSIFYIIFYIPSIQNNIYRASEMAQWVNEIAAMSDDSSSNLMIPMVEKEKTFPKIVLWPSYWPHYPTSY